MFTPSIVFVAFIFGILLLGIGTIIILGFIVDIIRKCIRTTKKLVVGRKDPEFKDNLRLTEDVEGTADHLVPKDDGLRELLEEKVEEFPVTTPVRKTQSMCAWDRIQKVELMLEKTDRTLDTIARAMGNQLQVTATIETSSSCQSKFESQKEVSEKVVAGDEEIKGIVPGAQLERNKESLKEVSRQEEIHKEEIRQEETSKEESHQEKDRGNDTHQKETCHQEDIKQAEIHQEEIFQEKINQEKTSQEEFNQEETRQQVLLQQEANVILNAEEEINENEYQEELNQTEQNHQEGEEENEDGEKLVQAKDTSRSNIKQAIVDSLDRLRILINEKNVDEDKKHQFEYLANKAVSTLNCRFEDLIETGDESQIEAYIQDIIVNSFEKKLNELITSSLRCDNLYLNTDDDVNNISSLEEDTLQLTLDIESDGLDVTNKEFDEIFEQNYKAGEIDKVDLNIKIDSPARIRLPSHQEDQQTDAQHLDQPEIIGDFKHDNDSLTKISGQRKERIGDGLSSAKTEESESLVTAVNEQFRPIHSFVEREISLDDLENAILQSFKDDLQKTKIDWKNKVLEHVEGDNHPTSLSMEKNSMDLKKNIETGERILKGTATLDMEELMKPLTNPMDTSKGAISKVFTKKAEKE